MTNPAMKQIPKRDHMAVLERERKARRTGAWGPWETKGMMPGSVGYDGWLADITRAYRNRCFSVLERRAEAGVVHLAVSSLTGVRPTWQEMQRIKNELAGTDATAIEVYPPQSQVVDAAPMFHIWVLRGQLPFGLHLPPQPMAGVLRHG